jgi:uncharacterized membrane protein
MAATVTLARGRYIKKAYLVAGVLLLGASFLLIAVAYPQLPNKMAVFRGPFGVMIARKSFFTAFRVPVMNSLHAMIAWFMWSRAEDFENCERRNAFASIFAALLLAIALKSAFEALEISADAFSFSASVRALLTTGTLLSVAGGLASALFRFRRVRLPWSELRLSFATKAALLSLFVVYLGCVAASIWISK